jgi:hypothetical protein
MSRQATPAPPHPQARAAAPCGIEFPASDCSERPDLTTSPRTNLIDKLVVSGGGTDHVRED